MIERIETADGHVYLLDGQPIPGVTTVIGDGLPKPAIPYWAARTVAEYVADNLDLVARWGAQHGRTGLIDRLKKVPWHQRRQAAQRGTAVHALAERMVQGHVVDAAPDVAGHAQQVAYFMDRWGVVPVLVERPVVSYKWLYAGTFDLVADISGGRRVILDYKTTRTGVYGDTALQLAAYRWADEYRGDDGTHLPMLEVGIDGGLAVHVRRDGYDVYELDTSEEMFANFLAVRQAARVAKLLPGRYTEVAAGPDMEAAA